MAQKQSFYSNEVFKVFWMLRLSNLLVKKTVRNVFFNSKWKKGPEKVGLWPKVGEIRVKFGRPIDKKVTGLSGQAGLVAQKLATMASDIDRK